MKKIIKESLFPISTLLNKFFFSANFEKKKKLADFSNFSPKFFGPKLAEIVSPPKQWREKRGNFKIGIIFDWRESFLFCLCSNIQPYIKFLPDITMTVTLASLLKPDWQVYRPESSRLTGEIANVDTSVISCKNVEKLEHFLQMIGEFLRHNKYGPT